MVNNISNHCTNDEWSPIHIAEVIGFTGEISQWKLPKISLL